MLRTVQIGLKIEDLDYLEYGEIFDMFIESGNDHCEYKQKATQADFDKF
jgi:hypothetical protein